MKDYYKVLGSCPTSTKEKIQENYRNLSKRFREMSDKEQREIIAALKVLENDDQRKEYDAQPQFQIRKTSPKLANVGPKKQSAEKQPFKWGIPLMEILLMPFKGEKEEKEEQTNEEKANFHFSNGVLMAENVTQLPAAKTEFESIVKLVTGVREAHYNLGLVLYRLGRYSEAVKQFKQCLEIESKDNHAKKMIALLE